MPAVDASQLFTRAIELDRAMHALAHPVRRFLLELIIIDGANAGDLAASAASMFGISPPRASQHLRILATAGLVEVTVDGPWRFYRLKSGSTDAVTRWLNALQGGASGRESGR